MLSESVACNRLSFIIVFDNLILLKQLRALAIMTVDVSDKNPTKEIYIFFLTLDCHILQTVWATCSVFVMYNCDSLAYFLFETYEQEQMTILFWTSMHGLKKKIPVFAFKLFKNTK